MQQRQSSILTINSGSSSIKFSLYSFDDSLQLRLYGKIERIGTGNTSFIYEDKCESISAENIEDAALFLLEWLEQQIGFEQIIAVGHRIVLGMAHTHSMYIDESLLQELKQISKYDPDHLPGEIMLIEKIRQRRPKLKQVACFDTSFHTTLPRVATMFPIPRRFETEGIRRYGFHGLSYSYLLEKLRSITGGSTVNGHLILAHLGSGCSMAAVKNGRSIDTTMGFTPTGGLMMGTRSGDLDPGIIAYLFQNNKFNAQELTKLINHESGLLGVSETSSDMQELLAKEQVDLRAAEAISLFCYQAKKEIGAMASVLNGLDTLVFSGGIGENAPAIRSRICTGLEYLGITLNEEYNQQNELLISLNDSHATVYVIPTNEEYMIARITYKMAELKN